MIPRYTPKDFADLWSSQTRYGAWLEVELAVCEALAERGVIPAADMEALPDATDEATYHLASVGWLRHHLGWREDDRGDEEPG